MDDEAGLQNPNPDDIELARVRERLLTIARITTPMLGTRSVREQIQELIEQVC